MFVLFNHLSEPDLEEWFPGTVELCSFNHPKIFLPMVLVLLLRVCGFSSFLYFSTYWFFWLPSPSLFLMAHKNAWCTPAREFLNKLSHCWVFSSYKDFILIPRLQNIPCVSDVWSLSQSSEFHCKDLDVEVRSFGVFQALLSLITFFSFCLSFIVAHASNFEDTFGHFSGVLIVNYFCCPSSETFLLSLLPRIFCLFFE